MQLHKYGILGLNIFLNLLHGNLATNMFQSQVDRNVGESCMFCNEPESVHHMFVECHCLLSLLSLLSALCGEMGVVFSWGLYTLGPMYSVRTKLRDLLMNFLFGQAKLTSWITRHDGLQGLVLVDPELLFKGMVSARLHAEFEFYSFVKGPIS